MSSSSLDEYTPIGDSEALDQEILRTELSPNLQEPGSFPSSGFPTRDILSGLVGAVAIHFLIFAYLVASPMLSPNEDFNAPFLTVNIVVDEPAPLLLDDGERREGIEGEAGIGLPGKSEAPESATQNALHDYAPADFDPPQKEEFSALPPVLETSQDSEPVPKPERADEPKRTEPLKPESPRPSPLKPEKVVKQNKIPLKAKKERPKAIARKKTEAPVEDASTRSASLHSGIGPSPSSKSTSEMSSDLPSSSPGNSGVDDIASTKKAAEGSNTRGGSGSARQEFQLAEVDKAPTLLKRVEPDYPQSAKRLRLTGKVIVRFLVDPQGRVRKASIIEAHPEGMFESCVLEAVARWVFKPGYHKGEPVATWIVVPIKFKFSG